MTHRLAVRLILVGWLAWLAGCGVKVGDIRTVEPAKPAAGETAMVVGKVRFIVDGKPLTYNMLNRPLMRLYRFADGQYYETPMVNADGSFAWSLPEGGYEIAVLFGGLSPTGSRMLMRTTGKTQRVNGLTYPGYRFFATVGETHYLGTLVVDVTSRPMKGVILDFGERVFGSLNGMRVENESESDPLWQAFRSRPGAVTELFEPMRFQIRPGRDR